MAKAKKKARGYNRREAGKSPAKMTNEKLNTISESTLDYEDLGVAELIDSSTVKDDRYDLEINYSDAHEEKLDFDALGSFIDQQPKNHIAQLPELEEQPEDDMSISFDEDETDEFPAAAAQPEDDGIMPEEQPVLRGKGKKVESLESFFGSLGLDFDDNYDFGATEPSFYDEKPDAEELSEEPAETEESENEPEAVEESIEEDYSLDAAVEEESFAYEEEPDEEAEEPAEIEEETEMIEDDTEEEYSFDEIVEELSFDYEEEPIEEAEEPAEIEEEPEIIEEEAEEEYSFDEIVEELSFDFDEEPVEEAEEPAEIEEEPEIIEEEAEEDYSYEDIVREFGFELSEEPSETEQTEEVTETYTPAEPLDEYDFFAASDSEEELYAEPEKPADEFFGGDEDDDFGLSEAQLRAIEHAREIRENGFSFDYEPGMEFDETAHADELLNFDDFDEIPEEEVVRPNIGIAYGVEEQDMGIYEEYAAERDEKAPVLPERKSIFDSIFGRFNIKKQPVVENETIESGETEPEITPTSEAYEPQTEYYENEAQEETNDERIVEEPHEEAADVKMAEGFSAAELAAAHAAEISDDDAEPAEYAAKGSYTSDIDYDYNDPDGDSYGDDNTVDDFPSFKEFVIADISAFLIKLGTRKKVAASTIAEDEEDLGPECRPIDAMLYYGRYREPLRKRCLFAVPVLLLMVLMSLGLPLPGMLKSTAVAAAALLAMQLTIMLIALDVVTNAVMNAVRGKIGADCLAVIACIATSFDAILVINGISTAHVPLCLFSALSVTGILFSSMLNAQSLRKTFRVPAIGQKTYVMTAENELTDKGTVTLLKSTKSIKGFVRRSEEAAPDEWIYLAAAPYLLIAVAVLSIIVTAVTRDFSKFIYTFSAVLAMAVPFSAVICFAMPFFISAIQIFYSGAAIAGWSGVNEIGRSREIVITDRDLFPEENVKIQDVRLFSDVDADSTVSYVGTIIVNSGSCLAPAFEKYMKTYGIERRPVVGYEYLPGGGLKGIIDSNVVLLGNADMMRLMGIAVKSSLIKPNTIAIAVNNCLYGFIDVEYTPEESVREALIKLMASSRHPIFAIRDFNVTPALIRELYQVPTDGYDFPSYIERFRLSSAAPDESSLPAAILCTEGLAPLTRTANAGRSVYVATRVNMWVTAVGAVLGAIIAAVQIMTAGVVSMPVLAIFAVLVALPVMLVSVFMKI